MRSRDKFEVAVGPEVRFTHEARDDLSEAYAWYESRRTGLGEEFLTCFEASLHKLARTPSAYSKVYKEFRRAIIRRFPYSIFYEFDGATVTVFAVFHSSRNPSKWKGRRL